MGADLVGFDAPYAIFLVGELWNYPHNVFGGDVFLGLNGGPFQEVAVFKPYLGLMKMKT